jgi:hypothetical protein
MLENTIWRNNKKGTYYQVDKLAQHSETLEKMVVYTSVEEPGKVWVRPYYLFMKKFTQVDK